MSPTYLEKGSLNLIYNQNQQKMLKYLIITSTQKIKISFYIVIYLNYMYKDNNFRITPATCRDGPKNQRSCTDLYCCILYILYLIAIIVIAIIYNTQSVAGFQLAFDYDHNICLGNYPILYMPTQDLTNTVCINSCPINTGGVSLKCQINSRYKSCPTSIDNLNQDYQYKICHHSGINLDTVIEYNFVRQALNSINTSKYQLLAASIIALTVSLILLLLTFILPALMTYFYFLLFELLLLLIAAAFLFRFIKGYLPFVDNNSTINYKNQVLTLIVGIAFGLGFLVSTFVIISKRNKIKYVVNVLKIAKKWFWDNCYVVFVSILFSLLSIFALLINIILLYVATSMGTVRSDKHGPFNQFQHNSFSIGFSVMILIEFIWTHGIIVALSQFTFQSMAVQWYFNERILGPDYSRFRNFSASARLSGIHIGSICFGWILAWVPQTIISEINKLEQSFPSFYKYVCCLHNCCGKYFSIYSYSQIVMQSLSFMPASEEMFYLRKRAKNNLPNIYMIGNFYLSSAKIFIQLLTIFLLYLICIFTQPNTYDNVINLIVPLIVIWLISAQISTHVMSATGLVGDTITLMYCLDMQIQKYGYGGTQALSCPRQIRSLIRECKIV